MTLLLSELGQGIIIGTIGTFVMDAGGALLRKLGLTSGLSVEMFGRWIAHATKGRLIHSNIETAERLIVRQKVVFGVHYLIGIALGVVALIPVGRIVAADWGYFVSFGLGTSIFAWCFMFPAMGYGWCGMKAPRHLRLFRSSLANHLLFGIGLWGGVLVLKLI